MQGCLIFRHTVDVLLARVKQQKRYKPYTQKLAVIRQDLKPHKIFRFHGRIYVKTEKGKRNNKQNATSFHISTCRKKNKEKRDRFIENARTSSVSILLRNVTSMS